MTTREQGGRFYIIGRFRGWSSFTKYTTSCAFSFSSWRWTILKSIGGQRQRVEIPSRHNFAAISVATPFRFTPTLRKLNKPAVRGRREDTRRGRKTTPPRRNGLMYEWPYVRWHKKIKFCSRTSKNRLNFRNHSPWPMAAHSPLAAPRAAPTPTYEALP